MSGRSIVDTIIQGAAVDLLHSLEIAAAPLPPLLPSGPPQIPELAAYVQFDGLGCQGLLCLAMPRPVLEATAAGTGGAPHTEDWLRELTNQLMGRIKKRFLHFSVTLRATLPAPVNDQFWARYAEASQGLNKAYPFRTLRGSVIVLLAGKIDHSKLVYCGDVSTRDEGDIILF